MPSRTNHGVHVTIHMITFFCSEYFDYMALGLFICIWPHLVFWTILIFPTSKLTENTFFQGKNCALMIVQYDWGNGDIGSRWHFLWLDIFFGREIGVNTILEWMPISPLLDFISSHQTFGNLFAIFYARHRTKKLQRICLNISNHYSSQFSAWSNHYI